MLHPLRERRDNRWAIGGLGTWDKVEGRESKGQTSQRKTHTNTPENPGALREICGKFDQEKRIM